MAVNEINVDRAEENKGGFCFYDASRMFALKIDVCLNILTDQTAAMFECV